MANSKDNPGSANLPIGAVGVLAAFQTANREIGVTRSPQPDGQGSVSVID